MPREKTMKHGVYLVILISLVIAACNTALIPEAKLEVQDFGSARSDFGYSVAALHASVCAVVGFTPAGTSARLLDPWLP